jgi:hypothetical protein
VIGLISTDLLFEGISRLSVQFADRIAWANILENGRIQETEGAKTIYSTLRQFVKNLPTLIFEMAFESMQQQLRFDSSIGNKGSSSPISRLILDQN